MLTSHSERRTESRTDPPARPADPTWAARFRELLDRFAVPIIAVAVGALGISVRSFVTGQPAWPDHEVYRRTVRAWLTGQEFMPGGSPINNEHELPWVYPPFAVLALAPFAVLPLELDITVLFALDVVALATTLYLVVRRTRTSLSRSGALAVALVATRLALFLEPVAGCFHQGQINILLMGMVAVDCLVVRPRWPRGLLIGIAAAIKLMPAAFLIVLLARRDYRAAVTTGVTALAATALGFVVDFGASMQYWFLQGPAASASGSPLRSNQSILAVLARFEIPDAVQLFTWLTLSAAVTALAWVVVRRADLAVAVTASGVLALLVSPTSWSNHWVWLAPALLLMIGCAVRAGSLVWSGAAVATAIVTITAPFGVLSRDRAEMLSLTWAGHLRGASYVLLGVALIVLAAGMLLRVSRARRVR